jgi:hypothetical protein
VALRLLRKRRSSSQREIWEAIRHHFWQPRCYDFNVYSDRKVTKKLLYMHRNPRGPQQAPVLRLLRVRYSEDWFPRLSCGSGAVIEHLLWVRKEW